MTRFELNILGCGSATSSMRHQPSCQVLNIRDTLLMIDCGEGAQTSLRRLRLKLSRLRHIFLSHLHGDHMFGLPGLVSTMGLLKFGGTLTIHTFADGAAALRDFIGRFCFDLGFNLEFNVISPDGGELLLDEPGYSVSTFKLYHRVPCVGFLVREKNRLRHINGEMTAYHKVPTYAMMSLREGADWVDAQGHVIPNAVLTSAPDPEVSYAYCSDTVYDPRVAAAVEGVDWLYHEATYGDDAAAKARPRGHSTSRQAAQTAREAGVRHLLLGHYSKMYVDETPLLDQAREVFPDVALCDEGMTVNLKTGDIVYHK